jgi:hypothetical protein
LVRDAHIGEENIEVTLPFDDLRVETVEVPEPGCVASLPDRISPNLRDRYTELLLPAPRVINICAFGYATLRRSDSNTAAAALDSCDPTSRFVHFFPSRFPSFLSPFLSFDIGTRHYRFRTIVFSVHWPTPHSRERCRRLLRRTRRVKIYSCPQVRQSVPGPKMDFRML